MRRGPDGRPRAEACHLPGLQLPKLEDDPRVERQRVELILGVRLRQYRSDGRGGPATGRRERRQWRLCYAGDYATLAARRERTSSAGKDDNVAPPSSPSCSTPLLYLCLLLHLAGRRRERDAASFTCLHCRLLIMRWTLVVALAVPCRRPASAAPCRIKAAMGFGRNVPLGAGSSSSRSEAEHFPMLSPARGSMSGCSWLRESARASAGYGDRTRNKEPTRGNSEKKNLKK